jgi:D-threo-aldose 1-dehydrogenase
MCTLFTGRILLGTNSLSTASSSSYVARQNSYQLWIGELMIDPTKPRQLGNTAVQLSPLGIGCGSLAGGAGQQRFSAMIDGAWERGLRYFDTAPLYLAGNSETWLGKAMQHRDRSGAAISTKVGRYRVGERQFHDYRRATTLSSVQLSMERLESDYLDIVMIHDVDRDLLGDDFEHHFEVALEEAYSELDHLRQKGIVRAIGFAVKDWRTCLRFGLRAKIDVYMLPGGYTLLKQDCKPLLDLCLSQGSRLLVASPFNTGILATGAVEGAKYFYKPAPMDILERTKRIEAVCREYSVPLPAVALQFPLRHPVVAAVVAGHVSPEEVDQNIALLNRNIPETLWAALDEIAA